MQTFIDAIRKAVEAENWHAAIFLALTMPDICSGFEQPEAHSKARYIAWFDKYLKQNYFLGFSRTPSQLFTARDCYALRCALLHQGIDDVSDQKSRETVNRVKFTTRRAHVVKIADFLMLDVSMFCAEVCTAVEAWSADVRAKADVQARISLAAEVVTETFSPFPGVRVG